jgi:beta-phosphoglucomutase family hydrolase
MQAVIFDMDGTMINNMMVHHRAWQQKLAEFGLEMTIEEVMEKVHGINEEILERLFGDRFTPEERRQISREKEAAYREIFRPDLRLIDGLEELLDEFSEAGVKMAVASAAPPENVDFVLDHLSLRHYFATILHSKSVEKGKPNPEIYLKTAAQLGVDPAACLVFEDSPVGATAASRAGCRVAVITTTHSADEFADILNIATFIDDYSGVSLERLRNW